MRSGVSVELHSGERYIIFARVKIFLADIPAIKECIYCKGHAGIICCPMCLNAAHHAAKESIPWHVLTNQCVSTTTLDLTKFTKLTREVLHEIARRLSASYADLQSGRITKDEFELQKRFVDGIIDLRMSFSTFGLT